MIKLVVIEKTVHMRYLFIPQEDLNSNPFTITTITILRVGERDIIKKSKKSNLQNMDFNMNIFEDSSSNARRDDRSQFSGFYL